MLSNHLILCRPLLLLPSTFPSIRVFSNDPDLHIRWPKYWSFSISPSSEISGLISFRIDWFDLAYQGTLKSLLQQHDLKASVLQHSVFFMVHLPHPLKQVIEQSKLNNQLTYTYTTSGLQKRLPYLHPNFFMHVLPSWKGLLETTPLSPGMKKQK